MEPYEHVYNIHVKGRWLGRRLMDVARAEFFYPEAYFEAAFREGNFLLDGRAADGSEVLQNGQLVEHRTGRVEPPVTAVAPTILERLQARVPLPAQSKGKGRRQRKRQRREAAHVSGSPTAKRSAEGDDDADAGPRPRHEAELPDQAHGAKRKDAPSTPTGPADGLGAAGEGGWLEVGVVAVSKPATVPVHPTGRYYHNTLCHLVRRLCGEGSASGDSAASSGSSATGHARGGRPRAVQQRSLTGEELSGIAGALTAAQAAESGAEVSAANTTATGSPVPSPEACLHLLHRIDRLTSGLVLMASDPDSASHLSAALRARHVAKTYLVRVQGDMRATCRRLAEDVAAGCAAGSAAAPAGAARPDAEATAGVAAGAAKALDRQGAPPASDELADEGPWEGRVPAADVAAAREAQAIAWLEGASPVSIALAPGGGLVPGTAPPPCGTVAGATAEAVVRAIESRFCSQTGCASPPAGAAPVAAATAPAAPLPAALVTCPLRPLADACNVVVAAPDGKPAATLLVPVLYNAATDTSLVVARIFTGRTHQIRVHSRFLGHAVCGDPVHAIPAQPWLTARLGKQQLAAEAATTPSSAAASSTRAGAVAAAQPPAAATAHERVRGFSAGTTDTGETRFAFRGGSAPEGGEPSESKGAFQIALETTPPIPLRHRHGLGLHCLSMCLQRCPPAGTDGGEPVPGFCCVAAAGLPDWARPSWAGWEEAAARDGDADREGLLSVARVAAALSTLTLDIGA